MAVLKDYLSEYYDVVAANNLRLGKKYSCVFIAHPHLKFVFYFMDEIQK